MKQVIEGKRYDTATAQEIGVWWNGYSTSDFEYCEEKLYLTSKGNFFLAGSGGAKSHYARSHGNATGGGEAITPLSWEEAFQWAQEHLEPEDYSEFFEDLIEDA
jgi:hypothetical protein